MAAGFKTIQELGITASTKVTYSIKNWTDYLDAAAQLYKYRLRSKF